MFIKFQEFLIPVIFVLSICFKYKNTLCPGFVEKYWFLKKLEHFQFKRVWPWKNGPKIDDVIGGHVKSSKIENLFFSCLWINLRNSHTNSKKKNYFLTVLFQIAIAVSTLCPTNPPYLTPTPKANRINEHCASLQWSLNWVASNLSIYRHRFRR